MNPRLAACATVALLLVASAAVPAAAVERIARLENDAIQVTISLETGGVLAAQRKASGFEHRNPETPPEIVNLRLPVDGWDGHVITGGDARRVRASKRSPNSLTLEIGNFRNTEGNWPVTARVRYALDGEDLVLRLQVRNDSDGAIDRVVFPALGVSPAVDGAETLMLPGGPRPMASLFSTNTVRTHHDPFERLDPTDFRGWFTSDPAISSKLLAYPMGFHLLPTTWMGYEIEGEAIGWDVRDTAFQTQFAVIDRILHRDTESVANNTWTYRLSWHWFPVIAPGASWESPEVRLKFGEADWHVVARQHREWFDSWSVKPDRAESFQSSIGWLSHGVSDFDQIPEIARRGVEVGAPYFIVYGWYGYGMGRLSYDFHPRPMLGGVEGLRRNIEAARALGAYPLAWFNGTTSVGSRPEHQAFAKDWIVVDREGGLHVDGRWSLFDPDRPQTAADALVHFDYDMATPAKDYLLESVRRIVEDYGFPGFEMDQAGKNRLSYRPGSGPGPELGSAQGTREVYERSMQIVRAAGKGGIVVAEGVSDFMAQYFDSFWVFEGGGDIWRDPARWVEETTYLRYSIPHGLMPTRGDPDRPGHASEAFLLNAPLDIFADLADYPDYAAHLKRLHALKKATWPFLFGGLFSDQEGFEILPAEGNNVMARSYREPARDTVVVINNAAEPRSARVRFTAGDVRSVTGYRLDRPEAAPADTGDLELELGPYDVVVLVAERDLRP